jgi:hypothetical protein
VSSAMSHALVPQIKATGPGEDAVSFPSLLDTVLASSKIASVIGGVAVRYVDRYGLRLARGDTWHCGL